MIRRDNTLALTFAAAAVLATLTATGCKPKSGDTAAGPSPAAGKSAADAVPPTPVNVATATQQSVEKLVPVTGSISALQTVTISPKVTSNVLSVAGREGDFVHAGQVVLELDPTDFKSQLRQAQANLESAQAKLTQARTNYHLQTSQSNTAVENAQSALQAAEANLAVARQPQRNEQVRQSEIAVQQAQANYDKAVSDRKRYEVLFKEGATSASTLEGYQTTEKVELANLDNAKQSLTISKTGGRQEDIRASEEQVRQAKIALVQARANVQQNSAKMDDVRAAVAAVAQNEATVAYQKQQLAYCVVKSPIDGIISSRSVEIGGLAGPGAASFGSGGASSTGSGAVMQIVALNTVYYQADVPETDIGSVHRGGAVNVGVDAFPGKSFTGTVGDIFPTASTTSRTFTVRVTIPNASQLLRPGMYARGNVVAAKRSGVVVPKDAVVTNADNTKSAVYVVGDDGKAIRRAVKVGIQTRTTSEILLGVQAGDQVIVSGQDGLADGAAVRVEKTPPTTQEASAR